MRVPVLIVDDFALKPLRASHDEDFHDLFAARYERAATILTLNLDFREWGDALPDNRILGAAKLDRLRHGAYRVVIEGESFRKPKPMPENGENAVAKSGKKRILESLRNRVSGPFHVASLRRSSPARLRRSVTWTKRRFWIACIGRPATLIFEHGHSARVLAAERCLILAWSVGGTLNGTGIVM
ncbi:hypothetical protein PTKU15_80730 [Paraburkholderia terrae]|nr:hypothetical protein PTKU15_80730 [Paraburkholderia terrae]